MVKRITVLAGLFQMSLLAVGPCKAQDSTRTLVLSQRVGATITARERDEFKLFRQYDNFVEATAFQTPDGKCYVRVTQKTSWGTLRDTVVQYSSRSLLMMADIVNHFDALNAGTYEPGEEPTYILTAGGQTVLKSPAVMKNPTLFEKMILAHAWRWRQERARDDTITLGLSSGRTLKGKFLRIVDGSTFTFESKGKILPIPVDSVSYLLRYQGSYFWEGAAIGSMIGLAAGAAIGASSYRRPQSRFSLDFGPGLPAFAGAVIGLPIGFVVGGLVGASEEREGIISTEGAGHAVKLMVIRILTERV